MSKQIIADDFDFSKRSNKTVEEKRKRHNDRCRSRSATKRKERVELGLCPYCGSEREDKQYQLCTACRDRKRQNDTDNMKLGLCRNCGDKREDDTVQHCNKCKLAQKCTILKKKYGLTVEDYNRMFENQGGVCWICAEKETTNGGVLHIDHDEQSGLVRGLLCGNCNRGIGCLKHSKKLLARAIEYLETTKEM